MNSYKERYRYNQELRQGLHRPEQKKKRKHKASRHRKEAFSDHLAASESSEDDEVGHVIPTIEHIRLAGTTRRKLLERRISLMKEKDQHINVESRFSDRERKALSVYHPSSSHSSHHTRTLHTATILENEIADDSEFGANMRGLPNDQKLTRSFRNAALKRAERLLYDRKRLEPGSSSEADAEDSPRIPPQQQQQQQQRLARPSTYVARRSRPRSVSSEREYIKVPEVIDPRENNNDLPFTDLENEESISNYNKHILRVPSNDRRLRTNEGSVKNFSDNRSPPPLSPNEIRLHGNEAGARNFTRSNRLDFQRRNYRLSSTESKVRQYLKSAAQVSLLHV